MRSSRHRKAAATSRARNRQPITSYFGPQQPGETTNGETKMVDPHGNTQAHVVSANREGDMSVMDPSIHSPASLLDSSGSSVSQGEGDMVSCPHRLEMVSGAGRVENSPPSIAEILRSFPTREDLQQLIERLEREHKQDIAAVREDMETLNHRIAHTEAAHSSIYKRLAEVECKQILDSQRYIDMALKMEDLEDRGRRNNVRLRGLPESINSENLLDKVVAIFNTFLDVEPQSPIVIDRLHRTPGPRLQVADRPRDVLCRLHYFSVKETIVKQAWFKKHIDFDGHQIRVLPDLSRATLIRRSLLQPLLGRIRDTGATYRWGFPFHLLVRKDNQTYVLRRPGDLTGLYRFLNIEPISVPDWLLPFPELVNKPQRRRSFSDHLPEHILPPGQA